MRDWPAPLILAPILMRQVGEIDDFRLARGIVDHACGPCASEAAISAVWVPPTVTLGKWISPPMQALRRLGVDIAGLDLDFGAELFQRHQQEIDRPRADGAAAGQRHPRLAHARQQRRDDPEARAHLRDQLIGRHRVDDVARGEMDRAAGVGGRAMAAAVDRMIDADDGRECAAACSTSARLGTFSSVSVSAVSSEAIISGRAAFLAPEMRMTPFSAWPPTMRMRSINPPFQLACAAP